MEWKVCTKEYPEDILDDIISNDGGSFVLPNNQTITLRGRVTFGDLFHSIYEFYQSNKQCYKQLGDNVHFEGLMKSFSEESKWFVWLS